MRESHGMVPEGRGRRIRFHSVAPESRLEVCEPLSGPDQEAEPELCFGHCPDCVQAPFCVLFCSTN